MTKVLCKKYNEELDAIPFQPLPSELGKKFIQRFLIKHGKLG